MSLWYTNTHVPKVRAESAFGFWFIHVRTTAMADAAMVPHYSVRATLLGVAVMVKEVR